MGPCQLGGVEGRVGDAFSECLQTTAGQETISLQIQSSSSSCSQTRLLCVRSAQPDPGNYSANESGSGVSHTHKKGGNFSHLNAFLTAKQLSSFEIARRNKILHFLGSQRFLVCFTTNRLFSLVFLIKIHLPQTSTYANASSGKFRGEALKQC